MWMYWTEFYAHDCCWFPNCVECYAHRLKFLAYWLVVFMFSEYNFTPLSKDYLITSIWLWGSDIYSHNRINLKIGSYYTSFTRAFCSIRLSDIVRMHMVLGMIWIRMTEGQTPSWPSWALCVFPENSQRFCFCFTVDFLSSTDEWGLELFWEILFSCSFSSLIGLAENLNSYNMYYKETVDFGWKIKRLV